MKPELSTDLKLSEIITHYPETRSVFSAHGLGVLVSPDGLRALAPFLTLGAALRSRQMDADRFLGLLAAALPETSKLEAPGLEAYHSQGDLSLLALMPCGLKMPLSRNRDSPSAMRWRGTSPGNLLLLLHPHHRDGGRAAGHHFFRRLQFFLRPTVP
jgi:hypothetical protein